MAVDLTLLNSNSIENIETNFERVETALQDAVSRSGTTPNQMTADLDMNSNDILNVNSIDTDVLYINGEPVVPDTLGTLPANSVGSSQIVDGSVGTTELADSAVTTAKLNDGATTEPKLNSTFTNTIIHTSTDRTSAKAVDTTRYNVIDLQESGREGLFDLVDYSTYTSLATADTTEAIIFRSTQDNTKAWLRRYHRELNPVWAGASVTSTTTQNKTALQAIYAIIDELGYGNVIIPSGINYGYDTNDVSTYPNSIAKADGITVDFMIFDYSPGVTYTAPSKEGSQVRFFAYTPQTSPTPGLHDGNTFWWAADWSPWIILNNTANYAAVGDPSRTSADNRRTRFASFNDGVMAWSWGHGNLSGAGYDDDELSAWNLAVNVVPGLSIPDITTVWEILKTDLTCNWYTNDWAINFRNNSATKHFTLSTSENTQLLNILSNQNNSVQWTVDTGTIGSDNALRLAINGSARWDWVRDGHFYPAVDNSQNIGAGSLRLANLYSANGVTTTSDERHKINIKPILTDELVKAAKKIDIVEFQWIKSLEEKGEENSRHHFGVIAQQVKEAFESEGLDPFKYGVLCYDSWDNKYDTDGNIIKEAGDIYSVRYDQLYALLIACERKRSDDIEARLNKLENS